jgi:hypothetical protein
MMCHHGIQRNLVPPRFGLLNFPARPRVLDDMIVVVVVVVGGGARLRSGAEWREKQRWCRGVVGWGELVQSYDSTAVSQSLSVGGPAKKTEGKGLLACSVCVVTRVGPHIEIEDVAKAR